MRRGTARALSWPAAGPCDSFREQGFSRGKAKVVDLLTCWVGGRPWLHVMASLGNAFHRKRFGK